MIQQLADRIEEKLTELKTELVQKYDELGMRASGNFERELEVRVSVNGNRISAGLYGASYTIQLVFGRRPGRFPPIDAIEQWISDKGISSELPSKSLAYLISRKIANEGTEYYKQGGTDLLDFITEERLNRLVEESTSDIVSIFVKGFITQLQKI